MNLGELLNKKEDLHPELAKYYVTKPFQMIKSPLYISIMHDDNQNALANFTYERKKEQAKTLFKQKEWESYIFLHERPFRLETFLRVKHLITSGKTYWEILSSIWTDSEGVHINKDVWEMLFRSTAPGKKFFMDASERKKLKELPETLTVYRGYVPSQNEDGLSYTLSHEKAKWFSNRFNIGGKVKERTINKSQIFAYLNGRGEDEILIID